MTATNKRLLIFESRGDSNRCTPYRGKPDQHTTRFSRSVHVWSKTICISRSPHIATLREMQQIWTDPTPPEKKWLPTQSIARRLTDPWVHTQFLSWANQWSRGVSQAPVGDQLLGLPGPYHWYAIGTFNTCSRGPTHRSLTDTDGATNLEVPAYHIPLPDLPNQLSLLST
jgi:hypothetical protein